MLDGRALDVIDFVLRMAGKEPDRCKTQASPHPIHQPLALSRLAAPSPAKEWKGGLGNIREWMADFWGCTSYAFDVSRTLQNFDGAIGEPVRAIYGFKTLGGPPQLWILNASREYPRVTFTLDYAQNLSAGRWNGPAGKMVYRDGRYLEALVQNARADGSRNTIRALRFDNP